jgi:hypothetical protein
MPVASSARSVSGWCLIWPATRMVGVSRSAISPLITMTDLFILRRLGARSAVQTVAANFA